MEIILFALLGLLGLVLIAAVVHLIASLGGCAAARLGRARGKEYVWAKRARWLISLGLLALLGYSVYDAIYPSDGFYLDEFSEVTLRDPPATVRVVAKSASYPDLHGDYCSFSRIELSQEDYANLLAALEGDRRMEPQEDRYWSDRVRDAQGGQPTLKPLKSFRRTKGVELDHHLSLTFLSDRKSIEVNLCVT